MTTEKARERFFALYSKIRKQPEKSIDLLSCFRHEKANAKNGDCQGKKQKVFRISYCIMPKKFLRLGSTQANGGRTTPLRQKERQKPRPQALELVRDPAEGRERAFRRRALPLTNRESGGLSVR